MGGKKVKLFNKTLEEFTTEYSKLTKSKCIFELVDRKDLEEYKKDINEVTDFFTKKEKTSLKKVALCVKLELDSMNNTIYNNNLDIIWNYLQNLFYITLSKDELIKENLKLSVTTETACSSGMDSIVQDISKSVMEKLKNTDVSQINPQTLFSQLISGNTSINGIDFASIIETAAKNIQNKAENGEIDLEKLKELSSKMLPDSFK